MNRVELLSPAGSLEKLRTVYRYGADAAYVGGKAFNLRAQSSNFSKDELREAVALARYLGKKIYVTLNIYAHDREINALPAFVRFLDEIQPDAVIVADLGVVDVVQENSSIPIHISTQSSSTNWRSVKMWAQMGVKRVVLARELSLDEIRKIRDKVPGVELEVFVHGAMCMTYSGRCQLSSYLAERDGNRGVCANTCRWKFALVEERRPGEYFPVYEDDAGSHIYNSKDLCTIDFLDKVIDAGVDGLKIEGRMKSLLYGATTTSVYRQAIESYYGDGGFRFEPRWREALESYSHRGYTSGFYLGKLDKDSTAREGGYHQTHQMLGIVTGQGSEGLWEVALSNKFVGGDDLEIIKPNAEFYQEPAVRIHDRATGGELAVAQANTTVGMNLSPRVEVGDIIRKKLLEGGGMTPSPQ